MRICIAVQMNAKNVSDVKSLPRFTVKTRLKIDNTISTSCVLYGGFLFPNRVMRDY